MNHQNKPAQEAAAQSDEEAQQQSELERLRAWKESALQEKDVEIDILVASLTKVTKAFYELQSQQQQSGMQWVKASERKPATKDVKSKVLCFRCNGMNFTGWFWEDKNMFCDVQDGWFLLEQVEWLDENPPHSSINMDKFNNLLK